MECDGLHNQPTLGLKLHNFGHGWGRMVSMLDLDLPRPTTSAAILTELAVEHGVPAERILVGTGIARSSLGDAEAEITSGQELELVRNLVGELGGVPGLGLDAGLRYHASTHGIWGFAVISSPTVRAALQVAARYFELSFSFATVVLREHGDLVDLVLDDRQTPDEVRPFLVERDVAAIATVQRDLLGTAVPAEAFRIRLPRPAHAARFDEITGNRPEFDAELTSITVTSEVLDLPLPQANPHTAALTERQCAELVQRRHARRGVAGEVRDRLARRSTGADQEDIARQLHLSVRTLRRQLAAEGTSFRELSDEVTSLLAEELLGAGLSVEEVARRLGYSSASSFTHAFRRWHNTTPGRFARAGQRTAAD